MIKVGGLVIAQGYNAAFRVCSLSKDQKTAEIELFNVSKQQPMQHRMRVPALSPFSEDARQAAARFVREATKD
jgi:hypothetical protein